MPSDEDPWMPKGVIYRHVTVEQLTVDVRTYGDDPDGYPHLLPTGYNARASVYLGLDGADKAIWKDFSVFGEATAVGALTRLWSEARSARLPARQETT